MTRPDNGEEGEGVADEDDEPVGKVHLEAVHAVLGAVGPVVKVGGRHPTMRY